MSANSMNSVRDLYSEKIEDVVFKLNELVKDDPKFIETKMKKFDNKLLEELKELKDTGDYEGSDEVLDDIHRSLKKPYEQLERKQLTKIVMDLSKALKKSDKSTDLSKMSLSQLRAKMMELSQEYDLVKIFSAQNKGKSGKSNKSKGSKESVRGKKKRTKKLGRKKRTYSKRK